MTQPNDAAFATGDEYWRQNGLTKREYFAAMAMQGLLASKTEKAMFFERISNDAVNMADALITALNENQ
jgi:hypothetical protein